MIFKGGWLFKKESHMSCGVCPMSNGGGGGGGSVLYVRIGAWVMWGR